MNELSGVSSQNTLSFSRTQWTERQKTKNSVHDFRIIVSFTYVLFKYVMHSVSCSSAVNWRSNNLCNSSNQSMHKRILFVPRSKQTDHLSAVTCSSLKCNLWSALMCRNDINCIYFTQSYYNKCVTYWMDCFRDRFVQFLCICVKIMNSGWFSRGVVCGHILPERERKSWLFFKYILLPVPLYQIWCM